MMKTLVPINYTIQEKINARLLSAGTKTIDNVLENKTVNRINVYCYAIETYSYDISGVDARYLEQIRVLFGI